MNLFAFALLADENINTEVVAGLRALGCDIVTVGELGLAGAADRTILKCAADDARVVITHDPDFGRLAVQGQAPLTGIVFVRPGYISGAAVLAAVTAVNIAAIEFSTPFVATVEQRRTGLLVRVRQRFRRVSEDLGPTAKSSRAQMTTCAFVVQAPAPKGRIYGCLVAFGSF